MTKIIKIIYLIIFGRKSRIMKMRRGLFKDILLHIDPMLQLFLVFRNIEPNLQNIMKNYIKLNDIVFDIGANIGYTSIAMSKIVGSQGKVYAFEPIPQTIDQCYLNIKLNKCSNITLITKALSDVEGLVDFRIPNLGDNLSMASMSWHKKKKNTLLLSLETIVLDNDKELSKLLPSFIKIDVEGAEGKVVLGIQNLIKKSQPVIFIECSKNGRKDVWNVLKGLNYHCFNSKNCYEEIIDFNCYRHDDFLWLPD